ncbi:hypothetical protein MPSI1_002624 [Malassezia psittaci]|uniref:2,5-diamino-6-ribosylamino-4(3H)-pyrimidinone 5'-phosphate reductase n=1 Tax=Malassezia psittaci TaxID=1821823 RepID=A0AAF0FBM5_9BASI|nr:hypothetical protein MPSI1_002624 [Malassezia psittaci]
MKANIKVRLGPSNGKNPRPVVLDDQLLTPLSSRLIQNLANAKGSAPLLLAAVPNHAADLSEWHRRRELLIHAGAEVCLIEADENGNLTWSAICAKLHDLQLDSVMVEGGATVIDSILRANTKQPGIIQSAIVTISPNTIGPQGIGYETELPLKGGDGSGLVFDADIQLGPDRVAALRGN